MRLLLFLLCFISTLKMLSQEISHKHFLHAGLNLVVPDYEPLFRENFDGRPGVQISYRKLYPKGVAVGIGAQTYTVRAITNNPNSFNVTKADFYSGIFSASYNIISRPKTFVAPFIESGFEYINYDKSEPSNFSGKLGAGLRLQYFMEELYGLEIDVNYYTIMTPFSPESFPENNTNMRFIMVRLGFTFDLTQLGI